MPVIVAQLVPRPSALLGVWLAGGALAFAGAMAYAELGAMRPHAGGEYVYIRDAYGPLAAFLTGWTSFVAGFSGAVAASALALAGYVDHFVALGPQAHTVVALIAVLAFTLVHVRGLGPGSLLQNLLALLKVSAIADPRRRGLHRGARRLRQPGDRRPRERRGLGARARAGDVHLLRVERGGVRRGGSPRSAQERAACARARHDRGRRPVSRAERALPVRDAGRAAGRAAGRQPDGQRRGSVVRVGGRQPARVVRDRQHRGEHQRDGAGRAARVLRDGARRRVRARPRETSIRASARPRLRFMAQGIWSGVLVLSGTLSQLVAYTGSRSCCSRGSP